MKRKLSLLLAFLLLISTLAACGEGPAPVDKNEADVSQGDSKTDDKSQGSQESQGKEESQGQGEEEPQGNQDGVMDICMASEPKSIDPAINTSVDGAVLIQHAFEGLIKWVNDGTGKAKNAPGMAESWDVSEDKLTWTFHLRDAKWSDGVPVRAQDFEFAWRRLVDKSTGADYEYMLDMVKGYGDSNGKSLDISCPDDKTFVVKLDHLCPYFEEICAFPATFPVRKDIIEANGDKWTQSTETYVSNGAYKVQEWVHNDHISFVKSESYYDPSLVLAEKLNFKLMDDYNAIYAAYQSGELDYIYESVPIDERIGLIKKGWLKVDPELGTYYVCFNNQVEPFDNPDVRKAFSLAIDRNRIVEKVTQSGQVPASGFVPKAIYDAKGLSGDDFRTVGGDYYSVADSDYEKNCEEARELMKKAGFEGGKGFPVVEYLYNTSDSHKAIAEALQNMWQEQLGVQVTLQNVDWNVFLETRKKGDYTIARHGWIADYNDPMTFLDMWIDGGGNNDAKYDNPEFDKLIAEAKTQTDVEKRMELMHKAEDILMKDAAIAPLYFYTQSYMLKPNIQGLYYTPLGYYFFYQTTGF